MGFEPTGGLRPPHALQACALDRSAIPPQARAFYHTEASVARRAFQSILDGYEDINQLIANGGKITQKERGEIKRNFEIREGRIVLRERRRISAFLILKPLSVERKRNEMNKILGLFDAEAYSIPPDAKHLMRIVENCHKADDESFLTAQGMSFTSVEMFMMKAQKWQDIWNKTRESWGSGKYLRVRCLIGHPRG